MEHVMQLGRTRRASSPATSFVASLGSRCDVAIIGPVTPSSHLSICPLSPLLTVTANPLFWADVKFRSDL